MPKIHFEEPSTSKNKVEELKVYEIYHSNGQLAEKGLIINNKADGVWKKYDEEGKLLAKTIYQNGSKRGKWIIWDKDGKVIAKGRYNKEGTKSGNWIYWSSLDDQYLERDF